MALTAKGNNLLGIVQKMLEGKDEDNATVTVEEIAEYGDLSVASVRGTMGKLVKEGFMESVAVETEDGKKRKRISLTDLGWETDTAAYEAPVQ